MNNKSELTYAIWSDRTILSNGKELRENRSLICVIQCAEDEIEEALRKLTILNKGQNPDVVREDLQYGVISCYKTRNILEVYKL